MTKVRSFPPFLGNLNENKLFYIYYHLYPSRLELACKACMAALFYVEEPYCVIYCIYCFFKSAVIGEFKLIGGFGHKYSIV